MLKRFAGPNRAASHQFMSANCIPATVQVVDSHTEGEPTRVVVEGGPFLTAADMVGRRQEFSDKFDALRAALVAEPRGYDAIVGAFLTPPVAAGSRCGVVFFNDVGTLGMCGHGLIGVVRTLQWLDRIKVGDVRVDTPVGTVSATLHEDGSVSVTNVPSRRTKTGVKLDVEGYGTIEGDVAYGGNWFFLLRGEEPGLVLANVDRLLAKTKSIRTALAQHGVTGDGGEPIDHVELFGPPRYPANSSRNFVLCPGAAYDRSPCGTGTSAKLACLAMDGKLAPGELWRQESVVGSTFEASYRLEQGALVPTIRGRAYVIGESKLIFQSDDPFREGIRSR